MNIIGLLLVVLGLCGMLGAWYGYSQNKTDDQKKKVYTAIGVVSFLLMVAGVLVMLMAGSDSVATTTTTATTSELSALSNANLKAMANAHANTGKKISMEMNRREDELLRRGANLR